jgi:hypothetical protein
MAASLPAAAQGILNSHQSITLRAPADRVWEAVKDFDGLASWHPMFSSGMIKSGANNVPGAVRTMTVKDGPSFDEELLTWDASRRRFTYRLIDPVPLPVARYYGAFEVVQVKPGTSAVLWSSHYVNNSDGKMQDGEVIAFINGAFKAGLDNLKPMLEGKSPSPPLPPHPTNASSSPGR